MAVKKLSRDFFARDTRIVAKELLGKFLVRPVKLPNGNHGVIRATIIETEAYCGPNDLANHASRLRRGFGGQARGRTPRTEVMFDKPGTIYVYLIYGMYHCLNIVTEREGYPAAVLIRGALILNQNSPPEADQPRAEKIKNKLLTTSYSLQTNIINGPGKLCRYFQIDRGLNKKDITKQELWIEDPTPKQSLVRGKSTWSRLPPSKIKSSKRIGIDYAGKYKDKLWRYYLKSL